MKGTAIGPGARREFRTRPGSLNCLAVPGGNNDAGLGMPTFHNADGN